MQFIDRQYTFSPDSFNENATAVMYDESVTVLVHRCASAVTFNQKY